MKKFNLKEKFLKITLGAITAGMLCGAFFAAPLNTNAATSPTGPVSTAEEKVLLADRLFTSEGINDPTRVDVSENETYYKPSDYVYYGIDSMGNPLLWRVLDNDADNAGGSGAMFLFSEQLISTNETFSLRSDDAIYAFYENCMHYNSQQTDESKKYDVAATAGGRFEFTYQGTYMETYEEELHRFVNREHYSDYFSAINIVGNKSLDVHELSALRPITKKDNLPESSFGMSNEYTYWTIDTVYGKEGELYSDYVLSDNYIFPLSLEELEKYVANYSGAPGMLATTSTGGYPEGWWLRTAYHSDEFLDTIDQNMPRMNHAVGFVDKNGIVGISDVNYAGGGGRFGINLEQSRISFGVEIEDGKWRLALIEPYYYGASEEEDFNAWIEDVKFISEPQLNEDGEEIGRNEYKKFFIGYENAIGRFQPNYWDEDDCEEFISVMIKDMNGNIKYYGTGDLAPKVDKFNKVAEGQGVASVIVPTDVDFDEKDGDKLLVFWERRYDDEKKTSFVSNMVEIECAHSDFTIPNCIDDSTCLICGEHFGEIDPENHLYREYFNGTPENPQHGFVCVTEGCPLYNQVAYAEDCVVVSDCIEIFEYCSCGNGYFDENDHVFEKPDDPEFVVTGFCEFSDKHYQPAETNWKGEYVINNIGNFLWVAEQINKGNTFEGKTITVAVDELDFDGIEYFDAGTSFTRSFKGTFNGNGVVIKNLTIDKSSNSSLFGYTNGATIKNIRFESVNILGGYGGGIVASVAGNTLFQNIIVIGTDITVDTVDGVAAGIVGDAKSDDNGETVIENCFVYGAVVGNIYDPSSAGTPLPLYYRGSATVINSYCLAEETDDKGGRTAEQMASGEIAYILGWGQRIGKDEYPNPDSVWRVYIVPNCGDTGTIYSNNSDGREDHDINRFVEADGFTWDGTLCHITMGCTRCDFTMPATLSPENGGVEIVDHGGGVRYTYTAIVDADNGYFTNETEVIAKWIQDVTVVEPLVKDFDGQYVSADDFMTNTKMNYLDAQVPGMRDAIVYFVDSVTGEYVGRSVAQAGTYSLVVDGRRNYKGQRYVFKEILTINKITLTIEIDVQPKSVTDKGEPEFTVSFAETDEFFDHWLVVKLSKLSSANAGEYTLDVSVTTDRGEKRYLENPYWSDDPYSQDQYYWDRPYYENDMYINSVDLEWSKTVKAVVLPQREVSIAVGDLWEDNFVPANPDYYGDTDRYEFTYGDEIPDPTEAGFTFDKGSKLSFQWYVKKYYNMWDYSLVRLSEKPCDVGKYVLRVIASATDNLVKSYIDIEFVINKKVLKVEFVTPENAQIVEKDYDEYYVFKLGEYPEFYIDGIDESDWAELNISFEDWYRVEIDNSYSSNSGYPTVAGYYRISVGLEISVPFGKVENYEINDNESINVYVDAPETVIPLDAEHFYDGYAKDVELIVPDGWSESDYNVTYTKDGETVSEILGVGRYTVSVTDKNGLTNTATVTVRREIRIFVKEKSIELSGDGYIPFDLWDLVFEAGYAPEIGHTIEDLTYVIDVESGKLRIVGWTVMAGDEDVSDLYAVVSDNGYGHDSDDMNVIHIYDNACDGECNVCGKLRAVPQHKGGAATCSTQAICDICGEYYGELNPDAHEDDTRIFVPNALDLMKHDLVLACCGEIISTEAHHADIAATCTSKAICYVCSNKGFIFGEIDPENHASEEIRYTYNTEDSGKHDAFHSCCDLFIETAEHSGGVADCVSLKKCEVCSLEYGELDPDNHTDVENHTPATCKTLAKCSACDSEYGSFDPDNHESNGFAHIPSLTDGSVHEIYHSCCNVLVGKEEHSGGEATCNSLAVCKICNGEYGSLDADNHASDETHCVYDPIIRDAHYVTRSCCGAERTEEAHVGGTADCNSPAICEKCGAEYGELGEHIYDNACDTECNVCHEPTRGKVFHKDEDGNDLCDECGADMGADELGAVEADGGLSGRAISAIAVGSTAVVGSGGFSLFWFAIKKKSWAELLGLLIG